MSKLAEFITQYEAASEGDKDTLALIMADVMGAVITDGGCGVLFVDSEGDGRMNVHMIGDTDNAPRMLQMVPIIYEKMFGVPVGTVPQ